MRFLYDVSVVALALLIVWGGIYLAGYLAEKIGREFGRRARKELEEKMRREGLMIVKRPQQE